MMEHVLTVYGYGYDIDAIAYDVDKSETEVLELLKAYKRENTKSGRHYSDILRSLIINRFKNGITPFIIEQELGMGKGVAKRLLAKEGFEIPKNPNGRKVNLTYTVIQHNNFLKCPECGSDKVNDLNACHWDEESMQEGEAIKKNKKSNPHSYCVDCGTEWYAKQVGKTKDEDGRNIPVFETRKVLFHELDEGDDE